MEIYINTTRCKIHVGYSFAAASVVGASVVGASVVGASVVGTSVVGASVRGQCEIVHKILGIASRFTARMYIHT